jgi:hypothetical protein
MPTKETGDENDDERQHAGEVDLAQREVQSANAAGVLAMTATKKRAAKPSRSTCSIAKLPRRRSE